MKNILTTRFVLVIFIGLLYGCQKTTKEKNLTTKVIEKKFQFENGDIIFQTSLSSQSKAIQLATKSKYSHCGMVFDENILYVYEAIEPAKLTPLKEWIARGENGKYIVKRLKNPEVLNQNYKKFCDESNVFWKKHYDYSFDWSDDKVYCSELVWKSYKRGLGIELCKLQKLSDFDLTNEVVKKKLKERYGNNIPKNETVVSPSAIFESELLETVYKN
jgi:uncharacterized protein YycO